MVTACSASPTMKEKCFDRPGTGWEGLLHVHSALNFLGPHPLQAIRKFRASYLRSVRWYLVNGRDLSSKRSFTCLGSNRLVLRKALIPDIDYLAAG